MKPVPFLGTGMAGKSLQVTAQRKLNVYLEQRPDGDKGVKLVAFGTPGMVKKFQVSPSITAPVRALFGTPLNLYTVAGAVFYQLSATGTALFSGPIGTAAGLVEMAYNPTQLVFVDGNQGYLYTGSALSVIPASFPAGANTITYVSTFFVAEEPGTQNFWVSNEGDGSTWGGTAFAAASQYSDNILAVDNALGNLVIFSQAHMEFWQDVGSTPQPFAPILSATNEWGLAAIGSRVHLNQSIYFLAVTRSGQVQVCQLQGYAVTAVSSSDVEAIINDPVAFPVTSDAVGLSYQVDKHAFYQLTFPTADRTFLFDTSTGLWSEAQSGLTQKYATRHLANLSTVYGGQTLLADSVSSNIYSMQSTAFTDNGATLLREIVTRHAVEGWNEMTVDELFIDMELGQGPTKLSGGREPEIMLQVSRDSAHTWETEQWHPLGYGGDFGAHGTRLAWQRLGGARVMTFRLRMTDPYKFVLVGGALSVRPTRQ